MTAVPNQATGLVFSEVSFSQPLPWEGGYMLGKYVELYNNSTATVFLDGMIMGLGWDKFFDAATGWSCTMSRPFRTDAEGVWSKTFLQFPGSGADFPVAPGATVLIARSAVDHTGFHWTLNDLSEADFEFGSSGTAGNPDVPDLVDRGPASVRSFDFMAADPLFLAEPLDLESLPRMAETWLGYVFLKFPKESIVDVTMGMGDMTKNGFQAFPFCDMALHPGFETLPGPAVWDDSEGAAWTRQRRVLLSEDGRKILQDTNTSMADFVRAWKTPGEVPVSLTGGM